MKKTSFLALVCAFFLIGAAQAEAPLQKTQVPGYYRHALGQFEVTALYDGAISIDTKILKNIDEKQIQKLLKQQFVNGPAVQTAVNAYLINTGDKLVLVDAGAAKLFGPTLGNITDNLKAAGYEPEQVDVVLLTHLHGDHVNGLIDADGKAVFPKAVVWSEQADSDYWLNEKNAAALPEEAKPLFTMALNAAAPYRATDSWKTFSGNQQILPGISSYAARGHTPGHSSYMIESGSEKLFIWGDLVHNHAVQFARPQVSVEFDSDQKAAVATREQIFAKAAKEKLLVGGMHLPFPGLGHVRKKGKTYDWVPVEFAPVEK